MKSLYNRAESPLTRPAALEAFGVSAASQKNAVLWSGFSSKNPLYTYGVGVAVFVVEPGVAVGWNRSYIRDLVHLACPLCGEAIPLGECPMSDVAFYLDHKHYGEPSPAPYEVSSDALVTALAMDPQLSLAVILELLQESTKQINRYEYFSRTVWPMIDRTA